MSGAPTPPEPPARPAPAGGPSPWQEWTTAGRPPDAAVAGAAAAAGVAAVVAGTHDGDDTDGLSDGTLVDDLVGDDGMTDEERDDLEDRIVADGAAYAATQAQWDTFNNLDWS